MPFTADRPKCMVEVEGTPLIDLQLAVIRAAGIDDITIVRGYQASALQRAGVKFRDNPRFATTNMVISLSVCLEDIKGDVLVSYGDIIYPVAHLRKLLEDPAPIAVAIDRQWEAYWAARFGDPLSDAETLKVQGDRIVEIGRKPRSLAEIEGQYMGLLRFRGEGTLALRGFLERSLASGRIGAKPVDSAFMTDMLQAMIDEGIRIAPCYVEGRWAEVDSPSDLALPLTRERAREIALEVKA